MPGSRRRRAVSPAAHVRIRPLAALILALALLAPGGLWADPPVRDRESAVVDLPRIRVNDARLVESLRRGYTSSPTFRGLVDAIERSDLIVYVERHNRFHPHEAGRLALSGLAGDHRYVRISLSTSLNERELVAFMAHELMHAVEVADADEVVDDSSLRDLYCRIGEVRQYGFDTEAARHVTRLVSEEMVRTADR